MSRFAAIDEALKMADKQLGLLRKVLAKRRAAQKKRQDGKLRRGTVIDKN